MREQERRTEAEERALAICKEKQAAIAESEAARTSILKGIQAGEPAAKLLLLAVDCIGRITGDSVFAAQSRADLVTVYARTCPHCFKAIERQTWEKQIIPAFHALDDANREIVKDSSGYHTPLFEVSYEADSVFRNGYENCPNLD